MKTARGEIVEEARIECSYRTGMMIMLKSKGIKYFLGSNYSYVLL